MTLDYFVRILNTLRDAHQQLLVSLLQVCIFGVQDGIFLKEAALRPAQFATRVAQPHKAGNTIVVSSITAG